LNLGSTLSPASISRSPTPRKRGIFSASTGSPTSPSRTTSGRTSISSWSRATQRSRRRRKTNHGMHQGSHPQGRGTILVTSPQPWACESPYRRTGRARLDQTRASCQNADVAAVMPTFPVPPTSLATPSWTYQESEQRSVADSDEVGRAFRDNVVQCSEIRRPCGTPARPRRRRRQITPVPDPQPVFQGLWSGLSSPRYYAPFRLREEL
jgi:hypothetical protein